MSLSPEQAKVAEQIRWRSEGVDPDHIRPISQRDDGTMPTVRAVGLAIWQEREAFVTFFASQDPDFDADLFRNSCANDHPLRWFDYSTAVPVSDREREERIKTVLKELKESPFNSQGHRFHYIASGDTIIMGFQLEGECIRVWDARVRRVGHSDCCSF